MTPDVASAATPGGLQGLLLWVGVAVGAATCATIFFVTVRHRLRAQADTGRDRRTQTDRGATVVRCWPRCSGCSRRC